MRRDQRGFALPSPVVLLSAVAVLLAAIAWFATRGDGSDDQVNLTGNQPSQSHSQPSHPTSHKPKPKPTKSAPPPVDRAGTNVLVYNNTHIKGLAGAVGDKVTSAGWHLKGVDNWQGTIPATTVYYGPGLKPAAQQLALDLGIKRIYPADPAASGMLPHGLTVILLGPLT